MAETTNRPQTTGILLNKAGKGSYHNQDAVNKLIKYIARENGNTKDDLICCGTFGATDAYGRVPHRMLLYKRLS